MTLREAQVIIQDLRERIVALEKVDRATCAALVAMKAQRDELAAHISAFVSQNDRLSERIFMCENEPSTS